MPHPTSAPIQDDDGGGGFRFQKKQKDCNCCCCCNNRWVALLASCHDPCSLNPESPLLCATAIFFYRCETNRKLHASFFLAWFFLTVWRRRRRRRRAAQEELQDGTMRDLRFMTVEGDFLAFKGTWYMHQLSLSLGKQTRRWTIAWENKLQPGMSLLGSFSFWKTN